MPAIAERQIEATSHPESLSRDYLKCWQCRHDGKKCVPVNVLVSATVHKCQRCARLGHACGPLERAPGMRRRRGTSTRNSTSDSSASQTGCHKLRLETTPSSDSFYVDAMMNSLPDLCEVEELIAANQVLWRDRSELMLLLGRLPDDAVLNRLNDLFSTRTADLSKRYRAYVQKVVGAANERRYHVNTASMSKLEILRLRFEMTQLQHLRLDALAQQPQFIMMSMQSPPWFSDVEIFLRQDSPLLICTELIAAGVDPASLQLREGLSNINKLEASDYRKAQAQIARTFGCISKQTEGSNVEEFGLAYVDGVSGPELDYPAAHLAYWNFDKDIAFQIATHSGTLDLPRDIMNQTIVHIAVRARDVGFLKRLVDFDSNAFIRASATPGHTPLDLATILDDRDLFGLLIGRGFHHYPGTAHLLQLAIAANSPSIVDVILERGMIVLPPYTTAVRKAIERRLEDIALRFVPWLEPPWTEPWEVELLTSQAQHMHLYRLVAMLQTLSPSSVSIDRPIGSLRQHLMFLTAEDAEAVPETCSTSFSPFDFDNV